MSLVAVCIPTYNQAAFLAEAVRSACEQSHPAEVWLSDDSSTDHTPAVVADLARQYPQVHAFRQERNLGMSGNPRWIVSRPRTDYIVKLDSDDRLHSRYVERLLALMQAHPRAGYGHCAVREIDGQGAVTRERRLFRPTGFEAAEEALRASVQGYRVAANICFFRRAALEAVDFYKTDMAFCDDWDLSVRLADAGWGNIYYDELSADYRVWDVGDVRAKRKLDEVEGCRRVIEESLSPAFARRAWDAEPLCRRRIQLALTHATTLDAHAFSQHEADGLTRALQRLGDSSKLRRRITLMRWGMGPCFRLRTRVEMTLRDTVKRCLATVWRWFRSVRG